MRATITTNSRDETLALGERLGKLLRAGDVVALYGDLGAGKTVLAKGIGRGLEIEGDIHSPTFTIIHEHCGPLPLYHIDLYRIENEVEIESIGVQEYLEADGVAVIEWAEKMRSALPEDRLDVTLRRTGDTSREIAFESNSPRMQAMIRELSADADPCD
ncbi:MAG: tRNA (adenosine(37)-N6)-threonylcarbamoyltransferase complex ATPase subunit type 1 TsaE [Armatimonadota bacterium]